MADNVYDRPYDYAWVRTRCLFCDRYRTPKNKNGNYRVDSLNDHIRRIHPMESVLENGCMLGKCTKVANRNILYYARPCDDGVPVKDSMFAYCFDCHHCINFTDVSRRNYMTTITNHVCKEKQTRPLRSPKSADGSPRPKKSSTAPETAQSKWEGLRKLNLSEKLLEVRDSCFLPDDEDDPTEEEYQSAYDEFMSLLVEKATLRYADEEKIAKQKLAQRQAVAQGGGGGASNAFGVVSVPGLGRT